MKKLNISDFLKELYKRFALPSPKFFQVIQAVGVVCAGIGFIPEILLKLDITPNPIFSKYISTVLVVAGVITKFLAKLPVENSTIVSRTTDKLPYTATAKTQANNS
jgi:hypothetical protein